MTRRASTAFPRLISLIACVLLLFFASKSAAELLVLEIVVNDMPKGEFFVDRDAEGRFWLPLDRLEDLGLPLSPAQTVEKSGLDYFSFDEFPAITSRFDEATLSLQLTAPPEFFPPIDLDLSGRRRTNVLRPMEDSAFVNYQLDYDYDSRLPTAYAAETEIGIRKDGWLFLSGQRFAEDGSPQDGFFRLMTAASFEWRDDFKRLIVGDVLGPSDVLAPPTRLAGLTFMRNFALDPSFIQYPTLEYAGAVFSPAEIDVYLNGLKIRTEKIPPGNFRLENFTGMPGYGDIEVVVRDRFGRQTRLQTPYYLSKQLLRPGLQEYSYSLGLRRDNYATREDRYGSPVFVGSHRYGWRRTVTAGCRLYADDELRLLAPRLDLLASTFGLFSLTTGFSQSDMGTGAAGVLRYAFTRRPFNFYLGGGIYSRQFSASPTTTTGERPKRELSAGLSWGTHRFGAFSVDVADGERQSGKKNRSYAISYSRRLLHQLSMTLTSRHTESDFDYSFTYVSFDYTPAVGPRVSARFEDQGENRTYTAHLQQNPPPGPGYGYLADIGQRTAGGDSVQFFAPAGEIRWGKGILRSDLRFEQGDESRRAFSLTAAGALSRIGGIWQLSRPIRDSFALVQTGTLAGVEVIHNGQSIGRTDRNGRLIIPEISAYFDNQISISDKDVPLTYALPEVDQYLSPPQRSGSCIVFAVAKSQPVTGRLFGAGKSGLYSLDYREIELTNEHGARLTIPTGKGGEFYFDPRDFRTAAGRDENSGGNCRALSENGGESVSAQTYRGKVWIDGREHPFTLEIRPTDDLLVDLGQVTIIAKEEKVGAVP